MAIQERYNPLVLGVNASATFSANAIGGFLCITSGTITVTKSQLTPVTVITALPVTAGTYYPMPFLLSNDSGGAVTLAGGASGVLGLS